VLLRMRLSLRLARRVQYHKPHPEEPRPSNTSG
jgi:hypothetical protein